MRVLLGRCLKCLEMFGTSFVAPLIKGLKRLLIVGCLVSMFVVLEPFGVVSKGRIK